MSEQIISDKYFEAFNFYFAKPINEILANICTPHVILYKDLQYYDDTREYLKRYYIYEETQPRIKNLNDFYIQAGSNPKPNLSIHDQNKIIQKRNLKIHKLFLAKLKNYNDIPTTHRDNVPTAQPKAFEMEFKILSSNIEESKTHGENDKSSAIYEGSFKMMLDKYEKNMMKISYESKIHDIYNPSFSSEQESFDNKLNNVIDNQTIVQLSNTGKNNIITFEQSIYLSKEIDNIGEVFKQEQIFNDSFQQTDASEIYFINEIMNSEENTAIKSQNRLTPPPKSHKFQTQPNSFRKKSDTLLLPNNQNKLSIRSEKKSQDSHHSSYEKRGDYDSYKANLLNTMKSESSMISRSKLTYSPRIQENKLSISPRPASKSQEKYSKKSQPDMRQESLSKHYESIGEQSVQNQLKDSQPIHSQDLLAVKRIGSSNSSKKQLQQQKTNKTTNNNNNKFYDNLGSLQHIKELVQKYHKFSDEFLNQKSKSLFEDLKKSGVFSKYSINEKSLEKQQKIKEIYTGNQKQNKKSEKNNPIIRSKTDDGYLKQLAINNIKNKQASPLRVIQEAQGNASNFRNTGSPSQIKKSKHLYRVVSNEGLPNNNGTKMISGFNLGTNNSNDSSKSIDVTEKKMRMIVKPEPSTSQERKDYKPVINLFGNQRNLIQNPQHPSSTQTVIHNPSLSNKSLPVSPNRKVELKLNLKRINQGVQSSNNQFLKNPMGYDNENNSYGFWSSRSSRNHEGTEKTSKKSADSNKDYYINNKYGLNENKLKDSKQGVKVSDSLTRSNPNLDIKAMSTSGMKNFVNNQKINNVGVQQVVPIKQATMNNNNDLGPYLINSNGLKSQKKLVKK